MGFVRWELQQLRFEKCGGVVIASVYQWSVSH